MTFSPVGKEEGTMEQLRAVVERITFQNAENGYSVIKCRVKNFSELVTVVGNMADVFVGSVLILEGEWRNDSKYGRQFSISKYEETLPATVYGIEKYLGSGLVKGIGPKFAQRIVKTFGKDTIEIIEHEPERLREVPGLGPARAETLVRSWEEQKEVKTIMLFLQDHDVSTAHASKIFRTYGKDSIRIVTENPFRLADDIWGIGFRTADIIAQKMGFEKDRYERLRSGLIYTLNQLSDEGHCFALRDQLLKAGQELLETDKDVLEKALDTMILNDDLRVDALPEGAPGEAIYLAPFYWCEVGVAQRLKSIFRAKKHYDVPLEELETRIELRTSIRYDETQLDAVMKAVTSKVFILTGGPGTGKTTTTLGIITALKDCGAKILLAAPTGRAAKRLSEATGLEAKTIHRLLEVNPPNDFKRNADNPLEGDVLILDECSMMDLMLTYHLLKAVPDNMSVIFVGDVDQLPSVGAGNVLRDLIDSGCFPMTRLTKIFRQAQESRIITNAHRINKGEMPELSNQGSRDFFFVKEDDPERAADEIIALVTRKLPGFFGVDPKDIQVLTPMQKGAVGAAKLNERLQQALNSSQTGLTRAGRKFLVGDRVMQIRNNYDKEVYNGDIGVVASVDTEERTLSAIFDDRRILYDLTELEELVLAYAVTIHKSQGSEYPIVVVPIMMTHYVMLQRNLLYTAVSRAKRGLVLVGDLKSVGYAVRNVTVTERNSMLRYRLTGEIGNPAEKTQQGIPDTAVSGASASLPAPDKTEERRAWLAGDIFERLSKSNFRSGFHLTEENKKYINDKGWETIGTHAYDILSKRIMPARIPNDGSQTPMKGHPVFVAQHATATCCRKCLEKWYGIPQGRELTEDEVRYLSHILVQWMKHETETGISSVK